MMAVVEGPSAQEGAGGPPPRSPGARSRVSRRLLVVIWGVAILVLATGLGLVVASVEPNSDYLLQEPWLVALGGGRFGVQFITYGRDSSAIQYGVVDSEGHWVSGPSPVSPRYGYFLAPVRAVPVSDDDGRVHIAWTLANETRQSFHYIQLESGGRVLAATGPLGSAFRTGQMEPTRPALRVSSAAVEVVWIDNGTAWATTLDLGGRVIDPPHPYTGGNVTSPSRVAVPGTQGLDSTASVASDQAGNTYYLWVHHRVRSSGREYVLEYELRFRRAGPGGPTERVLDSTDDTWWTTKPLALPGAAMAIAGGVAVAIVSMRLLILRRAR